MSRPTAPFFSTEIRAIVSLAGPLVAGQLAAFGMNVVDTLMAGRLSTHALASVALGSTVWMALGLFVLGTLLALPAFVAQLVGAGRRSEAGPLAWQALWLGQGLGLGLMVALHLIEPLLRAFEVTPVLVPTVAGYLKAIAWGAPAFCGYLTLRFFSEGWGYTRPAMYFGWLGVALNVPANYVFMYGAWGVPAMGAVGCGYATALVMWVQFLSIALFVARQPRYAEAGLFQKLVAPRARAIGDLFRVGAPIGVAVFMEGSLFTAITLMAGALGTRTVAAHQVALNFSAILFMVPVGIAMAITIRVGSAAGRGDAAGVRRGARAGLALIVTAQCLGAALMLLFPEAIAGIYTQDAVVSAQAVTLLMIAALFQISDGVQVGMAGALRGVKDTFKPMLLTVIAYWCVGLPTAWWFGHRQDWGAPGLWMGLVTGLSAAAVLLGWRFARVSERPWSWRHAVAPEEAALGEVGEALDPRGG